MPDTGPKSSASDDLDDLTRLAIKHGTDKWGEHFYTPVYHRLFAHLRDRPIRLLEIGVGGYGHPIIGGGSLAMWADYFPRGEITAVDIEPKRLDLGPRVKLYQGSQDDTAFLTRVSAERGPFDIVIDDGSHLPKHVAATFDILFPLLIDGGWYVIEDTQTAYWPKYGGSVMRGGDTMRLARTIIDWLHHAEIKAANPSHRVPAIATQIHAFHAFHNILAIEKGNNDEPTNANYDLASPFAVHAIAAIERELERAPTAVGYANLCNVFVCGRDADKAKRTIEGALARWPDHPALLGAALNVAGMLDDKAWRVDCLEKLVKLQPEFTELAQILSDARNEAAARP